MPPLCSAKVSRFDTKRHTIHSPILFLPAVLRRQIHPIHVRSLPYLSVYCAVVVEQLVLQQGN